MVLTTTHQEKLASAKLMLKEKLHKSQFPTTGGKRAQEPYGLVHSDVCGKIQASLLGGGHFFLMFIDDHT